MIGEFFDLKQTPMYLVLIIHGGKWISQYIWSKGESTEALAGRLTKSETRLATLQDAMDKANERSSVRMSELTNYLEERRSEFEAMRAHLMELSGEVRARREFPDDRRRK